MYRKGETTFKEYTCISSTAWYLVLLMGHGKCDHKDFHGSFSVSGRRAWLPDVYAIIVVLRTELFGSTAKLIW